MIKMKDYFCARIDRWADFESLLDFVEKHAIDDETLASAVLSDDTNDAKFFAFQTLEKGDGLLCDGEAPLVVDFDKFNGFFGYGVSFHFLRFNR